MEVDIFQWAILRDAVSLAPPAAVPIQGGRLLQDAVEDVILISPILTVLQQVLPIQMKALHVLIILQERSGLHHVRRVELPPTLLLSPTLQVVVSLVVELLL